MITTAIVNVNNINVCVYIYIYIYTCCRSDPRETPRARREEGRTAGPTPGKMLKIIDAGKMGYIIIHIMIMIIITTSIASYLYVPAWPTTGKMLNAIMLSRL